MFNNNFEKKIGDANYKVTKYFCERCSWREIENLFIHEEVIFISYVLLNILSILFSFIQ